MIRGAAIAASNQLARRGVVPVVASSQPIVVTAVNTISTRSLPAVVAPTQQMFQYYHGTSQREQAASTNLPTSTPAVGGEVAVAKEQDDDKKGWWDPMYSVPLGIAFAVPALHYEWYLVNEETQLAACFIAFTAIMYKNFGGTIQEALEEDGKRILDEHNRQEDAVIALLKDKIDDIVLQSRVVQDAEDIKRLKLQTYDKLNAAGKIKPQYDFKAQVERMLSLMEAEEITLTEKAKHALMDEATAAVTAQFASSAELKKSSLAEAVATLKKTASSGAAASTKGSGADVVQAAYLKFFQDKKVAASKIDVKSETAKSRDAILTRLNALAKNEGFFFEFDADGKPKMVV